VSVCLCGQCLEDSSSHCPFPRNNSFEHTEHGVLNCFSFWPPGVCLHWGVHQNLDMEFLRTWFSGHEISVLGRTRCGFPRPKPGNFLDMIFKTWYPQFLEIWSLHPGFPRPKKTWEILGYGFQDMVFRTWDLNFGAWIFTLMVSKIETWKLLRHDFQDVGSQFWDLDFTQEASQCPKVTGTH
jgi:hypothetical protein